MSKPVIYAQNVIKEFRIRTNKSMISGLFNAQWQYKKAVAGVSFAVRPGEAVAFLGPNGAGKTTTTKMLTGLILPTGGELSVLGHKPFDRDYSFLKKIGLVMGNKAGLNWDLTATQSFKLLQKIYEIPEDTLAERINNLSDRLQVGHVLDTQVRKLSLGERMKLELIGAILHDPEVLFLDEPTIGLDINSKKNVREFLRELNNQGKTLLLTSHDMDDISEVCNRVIIINHGHIMYDDSMESLNNQYSHTRYARLEFIDAAPSRDYATKIGDVLSLKGNKLVIGSHKKDIMAVATKISQDYPVADVTIEQVPLEVIISDIYNKPQ